jgi:vacuolar protein sorting-associated protein 13A/C
MKGGWVDLPMMREFRLIEPIHCSLPAESFDNGESTEGDGAGSIHFFVTEDRDDLSEKAFYDLHTIMHGSLSYRAIADTQIEMSFNRSLNVMRSYLVTVCNYGIDHTGTMSFETVATSKTVDTSSRSLTITGASALSAFSWKDGTFLVSLLPSSRDLLRLTHQATRSGVPVVKRSYPFRIEDVSICEGGIESTPIRWEDGSENSYFMYRILAGSYQSEVHIIPEFVVYNGSKRHRFVVRQIGAEIMVIPGAMLAVHPHPKLGLVFTLDYLDFEGRAGPLRVDDLKHQIAMIKSIDSRPIASVAVQTVVGTRSSRLVIKVGEPTFGASLDRFNTGEFHSKLLERDMIRTRFRFSELRVTLNEATLVDQHRGRHATIFGDIVERIVKFQLKETEDRKVLQAQKPVLAAVLRQCTFDWQRIFKDDPTDARPTNQLLSPERSQLSLIVHNFQILDLIRESPFPIILDSTSSKISFADLCIRCRGPLNADLVKVDLFDLNLSHVNGISEPVVIRTSEDFVWKILDIVDRISKEATAISGVDMKLEWDDREGDYRVIASKVVASNFEYLPPPGDQLFDINKARVSPFTLLVTFKRHPEASRYSLLRDATGANLVNYFTTRLKFTLEKAELKFSRYEGRNIKGPPSRLIEILSTVYISRIKLKVSSQQLIHRSVF